MKQGNLLDISALNSVASYAHMDDDYVKTWDEIERKASFDARLNFHSTHIASS